MKKTICTILILLLLGITIGCNLIAYPIYVLSADRQKKVPAEFSDIKGKRVCIWVWADNSLLFEYPVVRLDIANYVKHHMQKHLECDVVRPEEVENYRESEYEAENISVVKIGQHFKADYVLFIQVLDFRTHPLGAPNLFQGYINAECALYDCESGRLPIESPHRRVWSGRISIKHPKKRALLLSKTSELNMRATLLNLFAQELTKKFYDHYEVIE